MRRCGADKDLRLLTQFKKNRSPPPPNFRCYLLNNIVGSSYGTCIVLIKCRDNFATKRIKYYPSFLNLKCRLVGQLIKLYFETWGWVSLIKISSVTYDHKGNADTPFLSIYKYCTRLATSLLLIDSRINSIIKSDLLKKKSSIIANFTFSLNLL